QRRDLRCVPPGSAPRPRYTGMDGTGGTLGVDPGLPEERLQAAGERGARLDRRAREGPVGVAGIRVRDGEEADGTGSARAREVPGRAPDRVRRAGGARGDPAPSAA